MIHRLLNKGGAWHRPAHLDAAQFANPAFAMSWRNLAMMHELRRYYTEISPPFSKMVAPRVMEMEKLHDDIIYYHVSRSWYNLVAFIILTQVFIDFEDFERPMRHWRNDAQQMWPQIKIRGTHMREEK